MDPTGKQLYLGFEALMQCPLCNKRLNSPVYLCGSGHTLCAICMNGSTICVQCEAPYTKIPNLLAESLLSQFDYIKRGLNKLDESSIKSKPSVENAPQDEKKVSQSKCESIAGQYHCWITDECAFTGSFSPILNHFKNAHPLEFEEHLNKTLPHSDSWTVNYVMGNNFNRALNIGGLLFIFHISINNDEELSTYVLMYTGHSLAFRHSCRIEIECGEQKLLYKKGKVVSAQSSSDIVSQLKRNVLHITRNEPLYDALKRNRRFKCLFTIEKRDDTSKNSNKRTASSNRNQQITNKSVNKSSTLNISHVQSEADGRDVPMKPGVPPIANSKSYNSWREIKRETHVHTQLYPNLGTSSIPSVQRMNEAPARWLPMKNQLNSSVTVATAPELYERPPPSNPYYQQQISNSTREPVSQSTQKTKKDNCTIC